jgi:hypothetical protein
MSRSQSSSRASTSNNNFLSDNLISSTILVVLLVYAVFIVNKLPSTTLALFENWPVRFVFVGLILALALSGQYAAAILLTVGFVMSIQAANRNKISKFANMAVTSKHEERFYGSCGGHKEDEYKEKFYAHCDGSKKDEGDQFSNSYSNVDTNSTHSVNHSANHSVDHTPNLLNQIEQNLFPHENKHVDMPVPSEESSDYEFTTAGQFDDAQDNRVSFTNQNTEVRTWVNELGPQGLSKPSGYSGAHVHSPFDANTCVGAPIHN